MTDEIFEISVSAISFVNIYVPNLKLQRSGPVFSVNFPKADLPFDDISKWESGLRRRKENHLAFARHNRRVEVREVAGRYADLAALYSEADMRNIPRDVVLCNAPAVLTVNWFEWGNPRGSLRTGNGLALHRITINVSDLAL